MSDKKLAVLGIVAAAMLVIAIGVGRLNRTAERSTAAGASLIQGRKIRGGIRPVMSR